MWQANWMSLGIIVTLLACMAQRLASSMGPTIYASAASCRHMIALPWKCRSYLPTSRVILQTSCEKGSFWIRSSVLFWNHQISWRATVPDWYFPVFLTFPAWRNSFQGALPPMVGQNFLLTGSSLPDIDGPASVAIWANCWVSNNEGDLPTLSSCSASAIWHMISSSCRGASLAGVGGAPVTRAYFLVSTLVTAHVHSICDSPPLFPWHGVIFVLAILEDN